MKSSSVASTIQQTIPALPSDNASNGAVQLNNKGSNISLSKLNLFKSITSGPNIKRHVKEAKDLGKQVEYNLRLNGYDKHNAKVIGKLVKYLKEQTNDTQNEVSFDKSQIKDDTANLKGKKHSKIGFYFQKFINLFKMGKNPNKTSIDSGLQSLKNILNQNTQQEGNLFTNFQSTLNKEKEQLAFLSLFPKDLDVKKTKYPESIQIGNQTLTLKNVPGDGNCGIWSLLQLMHPEKNYLECFNANSSQEKEDMVTERKNVADFAKDLGASTEAVERIANNGEYLDTQDFKYLAQYYKKDIVICINSNGETYYETYHAEDGKAPDVVFEQPSYDPNAHYIYHQNDHFQALFPKNES